MATADSGINEPTIAWRRWLRRRVGRLLLVKLLLLAGLWWLFFSSAHRPPADAAAVADRLLPSTHGTLNGNSRHD